MLMIAHIYSRLTTIRLIAEASFKVQATVRVLLLPMKGARQVEDVHTSGKVASCRTKASNSRSELVMPIGVDLADKVFPDIMWPLEVPNEVCAVFVGVQPDPSPT